MKKIISMSVSILCMGVLGCASLSTVSGMEHEVEFSAEPGSDGIGHVFSTGFPVNGSDVARLSASSKTENGVLGIGIQFTHFPNFAKGRENIILKIIEELRLGDEYVTVEDVVMEFDDGIMCDLEGAFIRDATGEMDRSVMVSLALFLRLDEPEFVSDAEHCLKKSRLKCIRIAGYRIPITKDTRSMFTRLFDTFRNEYKMGRSPDDCSGRYKHLGTYNNQPTSGYSFHNVYVTSAIKYWSDFRFGCIFGACDAVIVSEEQESVCCGVPQPLMNAIKKLDGEGHRISDICVLNNGSWALIYDGNGYMTSGVHADVVNALSEAYNNKEIIKSISFNTAGEFFICTDRVCYVSPAVEQMARTAASHFGEIYSCTMSDNSIIFCCRHGVYHLNIPKSLEEVIDTLDFRPRLIRYAESAIGKYFIIGTHGEYKYDL